MRDDRRSRVALALLVPLVAYFAWKGLVAAWTDPRSDWLNYWGGARVVADGHPAERLYDDAWFAAWLDERFPGHQGRFGPTPPVATLLATPLTLADPLTGLRVWTVAKLGALALWVRALARLTGWHPAMAATFVLASGRGLANDFAFGHPYVLVAWASTEGWLLWRSGRGDVAGIGLGAAATLKVFPAVGLLGYALHRQWRVVGAAAACAAALTAISVAELGWAPLAAWTAPLLEHLDGRLTLQSPYAIEFQSWNAWLLTLFVAAPDNPSPAIDWPLGYDLGRLAVLGGVICGWVAAFRATGDDPPDERLLTRLAVLDLGALLLIPAGTTYYFVLSVFPVAAIVSRRPSALAVLLYAAIGFVPVYWLRDLGLVLAWPRLWLSTALFAWCVGLVVRRARTSPELDAPAPRERLARREDDEPVAAVERVRSAGHRLDGHAQPAS